MNYNSPVKHPVPIAPTDLTLTTDQHSAKEYFEMIDAITEDLYSQAISLDKTICGDGEDRPEYFDNSKDSCLLYSLDRTKRNLLSILEILRHTDRGLI